MPFIRGRIRRLDIIVAMVMCVIRNYPRRHFIVLATPRTGTNYIMSILNSHPDLWGFLGEPLSLNHQKQWRLRLRGKSALDYIGLRLCSLPSKFTGIKVMASHLGEVAITLSDIINRFPETKFIVLYRQSLLSQFVSLKVVLKTGVIALKSGTLRPLDSQSVTPIKLEPDDFSEFCEYTKNCYLALGADPALRGISIWISYEELVSDPQQVMTSKIFPFLGVSDQIIYSDLTKILSEDASKYLSNYSEVSELVNSDLARQRYDNQ